MRARAAALGLVAVLACGGEDPPAEPLARSKPAPEPAARGADGAPVIDRVEISPGGPQPGEQVVARVSASDPDGDEIELEYRWRVGGEEVGEPSAFLELGDVARGTVVEVTVVASDGDHRSPPSRATTRVGNQPPQVTSVAIEPESGVIVGRDLVATPEAEDPEGDPVRFSYRWSVDGEELPDDTPTLRGDRFERGSSIELEVVANDGTDDGDSWRSDPIEVGNAPPHITSTPGALGDDGVYRYDVTAEDPDGDTAFRYRLLSGPAGMTVGFDDGRLTWQPGDGSAGTHPVEVEVTDLFGGRATQPFEIRLSYADPAPAAPPAAASEDAEAEEDLAADDLDAEEVEDDEDEEDVIDEDDVEDDEADEDEF